MPEEQDTKTVQDKETAGGPVAGFIRQNKAGSAVAAGLIVIAAGIFWLMPGSGETEPAAVPTATSTSQLGPGGESPSATASPTPTSSSPTSTSEATHSASTETFNEASAPVVGTPNGPPGSGTNAQNIPDSKHAPELQDWEETAEEFAVEWADTTGGKEAWLQRIEPLVTEDLYESFTYTDIRALYDDKFEKIRIDDQQASYIIYTAYYEENGPLFQGLIQVQPDGSWRVKNVGLPE